MAVSSDYRRFDKNFNLIKEKLNVVKIVSLLENASILSAQEGEDIVSLNRKDNKSAVKKILKKIKAHSDGDSVFKSALEKSSEQICGHKDLLLMLYKAQGTYFLFAICMCVKCSVLAKLFSECTFHAEMVIFLVQFVKPITLISYKCKEKFVIFPYICLFTYNYNI